MAILSASFTSLPSFCPKALAQKQRFRVTLELDVFEDFDPNQIDWEKVLDVQGNESVSAYIEDLSTPDRW